MRCSSPGRRPLARRTPSAAEPPRRNSHLAHTTPVARLSTRCTRSPSALPQPLSRSPRCAHSPPRLSKRGGSAHLPRSTPSPYIRGPCARRCRSTARPPHRTATTRAGRGQLCRGTGGRCGCRWSPATGSTPRRACRIHALRRLQPPHARTSSIKEVQLWLGTRPPRL